MSSTSEAPAAFRNAAESPGPLALIRQAIDDIRSRRRLVRYLVQAEMKKRGADTLLGNLWWVLDPMLQMSVYVVFVTIIGRRPVEDYPLFIFAAILPWKWFTAVVTDSTTSVVSQDRLIKQIAFPKIVLPVSSATAGIVGFAFGLLALGLIMAFYSYRISPFLLLIPAVAVVQYVFTLAMAIVVSAGNVFFRDLGNVMRHFLRLWWYLSPGLYSLDLLEDLSIVEQNPIIRTIAGLNPFAILFEAYRVIIYGAPDGKGPAQMPDWLQLGGLLGASLLFLAVATIIFKRLEPSFAKAL
jgi:ABC-type polysaccharide/polyol phosphate export permease